MNELIQICTSFLGSLGFGILYNIKGKKLGVIGMGGMLSWIVYLMGMALFQDKIGALFLATLAVGALSEGLARILKTPVMTLLVPMLIPLVPGSDLFYATSSLLLNEIETSSEFLNLVIKEAAAIAFGIILITSTVQILHRFQLDRHSHKKNIV